MVLYILLILAIVAVACYVALRPSIARVRSAVEDYERQQLASLQERLGSGEAVSPPPKVANSQPSPSVCIPISDEQTSPILLERFNQVCALAADWKAQQALDALECIYDDTEQTSALVIRPDFRLNVELRRAYLLDDLGRHEESRLVFASLEQPETLATLDRYRQYDYYFNYGNLLGQMGAFPEFAEKLRRAIDLATGPRETEPQLLEAWKWLLFWLRSVQHWPELLTAAREAQILAHQKKFAILKVLADEARFYALRGLEHLDEAREIAKALLNFYYQQNLMEKVSEWQILLLSVKPH